MNHSRLFTLIAVLILAFSVMTAGCAKHKFYNRYPDKKNCNMQDKGSKKARK